MKIQELEKKTDLRSYYRTMYYNDYVEMIQRPGVY